MRRKKMKSRKERMEEIYDLEVVAVPSREDLFEFVGVIKEVKI